MRGRRSRLAKPWGRSLKAHKAASRACAQVTEPQPGNAGADWGDDRAGDGGEGAGPVDRVVAESLGVQETPVGLEADVCQGGQIMQPLADAEVAGLVEGGLGAERSSFLQVIFSGRVSRGRDLRRPVVDSVADETLAA